MAELSPTEASGPAVFERVHGILGVGTDLVEVSRIQRSVERFPQRFAQRILTAEELQEWSEHPDPVNYLAKAFAAKEAAVKALGTGIAQGVRFQDFRLYRQASGAPAFVLSGQAAALCAGHPAAEILISLSDDAGLVQAFAVLTRSTG